MRASFVVYGVLYVVIEMVGYQLELIGWPQITALDVASAVTNALLWVALVAAVLVALDVAGDRWRRHRREQQRELAWDARWHRRQDWDDAGPITVASWRSPMPALPPAAARPDPDAVPRVRLL
ncbi:hypothetical protein [Modestobacter lapidis]|nr:hypothetical protein [Modestobacter lapidis]